MQTLMIFIQVIVGLGILNVWLVRRNKETPFRGGQARSMTEEFQAYGLPPWTVPVVGAFKVVLSLLILAGLMFPTATALGAAGLGFFMLGAVIMHIKVQDSMVKTLPSIIMLVFCCFLALGSSPDILSIASNF